MGVGGEDGGKAALNPFFGHGERLLSVHQDRAIVLMAGRRVYRRRATEKLRRQKNSAMKLGAVGEMPVKWQ